ncbi:MAG: inositol monophosphatase [Candidatus Omnitrophica bacterium]|nr:inositol monophosphatase [Candidatus Omnitrophota bacterium]
MRKECLAVAIKAVETSGYILVDYFGKLHDFKQKNQNIRDLVTDVDILSEKNIKEKIREVFTDHTIIGEEEKVEKMNSEYVWHIDPLDGTVNYSQQIPFCAVSVGVEKNGKVVAGAIYNPFTQELFYASKGQGAFLNGQQINVSQKREVEDGLYVAAFSSARSEQKKREYEIFGNMNDTTRGVLRTGSAALSLAYLACGRIDGFWSKELFSWDLAAGIILVRESNGMVMSGKGREYKFQDSVLIASNKFIYENLSNRLANL